MKHLGDITKIKGNEVPSVDVIVGGSPCQDLSVAGKRAGLNGARSGLFMEQIRIIKEMRSESLRKLRSAGADDTGRVVPRFMVWENVQGAFSSNNGEDFRVVLEESAKVADESAIIPRLEGGRSGLHQDAYWEMGGLLLGAYTMRSFGECPNEERESHLSQILTENPHPKYCLTAKACEGILRRAKEKGKKLPEMLYIALTQQCHSGESRKTRRGKGILIQHDHVGTLGTRNTQAVVYGICSQNSNSMKSENPNSGIYKADTARTLDVTCLNPSCNQGGMAVVFDASRRNDYKRFESVSETVSAHYGTGGGNVPMVVEPYTSSKASYHTHFQNSGVAETLVASDYKDPPILANRYIVRRLTPLECERLQGYPDGYTDIGDWMDSKGKKHKGESDAPRYKALGNSIALPFWDWLAERIGNTLRESGRDDLKMASLFDGIGGFPLVFQKNGFKPVWASEIEEFPMAVTKIRFPD